MSNNNMSMHLIFKDGSNPYVHYNMTPEEFANEIKRWSRSYILEFDKIISRTIFNFNAKEKLKNVY